MKLAEAGELRLIERLRRRFRETAAGAAGPLIGIGDDAAVIRPGRRLMLFTTDMMVEGIHFDMKWTTPYQLGYKLVSVNVSDIYAMGGTPDYILLNFAAPGRFRVEDFDLFLDGLAAASSGYGISLIGGDMSSSDRIVMSATVIGSATRAIGRGGAKQGDFIHITGNPGDAAAGLAIMKNLRRPIPLEKNTRPKTQLAWEVIEPLIRRHLMPEAARPDRFLKKATAMMDVSDGLLIDLGRLCGESRVGARIWAGKIPLSQGLLETARLFRADPLGLALGGGEDYELLFTSASKRIDGATCIGEIVRSGVKVVGPDDKEIKVPVKGYEHFGVSG